MSATHRAGGDRAGTSRPGRGQDAGGRGPGRTAWSAGPQPLAGAALLDRLRVTGRARPEADPVLVADLRAHLGLDLATGDPGRDGPVVVTGPRLTRALTCAPHAVPDAVDGCEPTLALACGALIDVLFRQLVTTGSLGTGFDDGLDALSVDGRRTGLVGWIGALAPAERAELRSEVDRQVEGLRHRWPTLDPAWLPRTKECLRVPSAGGAFELVARVDLAVGRRVPDQASVALVDVTSGALRSAHAADRRFHALVETLRSGVPPFAVATYSTRTGELAVDPVTTHLLVMAARRCRAGLEVLVGSGAGGRSVGSSAPWCVTCADEPLGAAVPAAVGTPDPEPLLMAGARGAAAPDRPRVGAVIALPEERAA